jgi:hypothetical protein
VRDLFQRFWLSRRVCKGIGLVRIQPLEIARRNYPLSSHKSTKIDREIAHCGLGHKLVTLPLRRMNVLEQLELDREILLRILAEVVDQFYAF